MSRRTLKERLKWRLIGLFGVEPNDFSFSQAGEDRILSHLVNVLRIQDVCYVDIGANDPTYCNNTYLFYCLGGSGIAVDPDGHFKQHYQHLRPRDQFVEAAVGPTRGTCTMHRFTNRALNTLDAEVAAQYKRLGYESAGVQNVDVLTLSDVLAMARKPVDLLSIDAEGFDLAILESNDYNVHAPTIICVETIKYKDNLTDYSTSESKAFLESRGYVPYGDSHINTIFVLESAYKNARKI